MRRLVYTSTAKKLMGERDLRHILRAARTNNSANGLTGLLVYHDGCFLQALEGEAAQVEKCYINIQKDARHENCILMSNDDIVTRIFSKWWMTYRSIEDLGHYQKNQFLRLQDVATHARSNDLTDDPKINAFLLAFLSCFRDLDMAG